jgi:hypothetical protein
MDWIEDGLAIGNIEDAMGHDRLRWEGVRSILTLNGFPDLQHTPFVWHSMPLHDGPGNRPSRVWAAVERLADLHGNHAAVMVHCAEGKSRAVLVTTLYLARRDALSFDTAYARVLAARPIACIDNALRRLGERLLAANGSVAP